MRLALASVAGVAAFAALFVVGGASGPGVGLSIAAATVVALLAVEVGARRMGTRSLALLAALAALDAALRLALVNGIAGFSPLFFLLICAGYVFGPTFGFLAGALALLVSAVVTGGVGPWLPYEMFGCAWVGAAAGLFATGRTGPPGRRELVALAVLAIVLGYAYGAATDLFDWSAYYRGVPGLGWAPGLAPATLARNFGRFYLTTSAVWDSFRAVGTALAILVLGSPVVAGLRRFRARLEPTIELEPAPLAPGLG